MKRKARAYRTMRLCHFGLTHSLERYAGIEHKPKSEARWSFDYALDDEKWAKDSAELEEKLKKCLSE